MTIPHLILLVEREANLNKDSQLPKGIDDKQSSGVVNHIGEQLSFSEYCQILIHSLYCIVKMCSKKKGMDEIQRKFKFLKHIIYI